MNIALIFFGAILMAVGIIRMVNEPPKKEKASAEYTFNVAQKPTPEVRVVEREVVKYVEVPVKQESHAQEAPTTQPTATTTATTATSTAISTATSTEPQVPAELSAKEKGNNFEDYVANLFKDKTTFSVLEWNQGQTSSEGVYAENDKNPDFKIQQTLAHGFKLTYWIECKYRARFDGSDCIKIKNYQLNRYRQIQRNSRRKVLIAVGIGKEPNTPNSFYLIPLDSITGESLSKTDLQPFYMSKPSSQLSPRVADWFQNEVFKKKRK